MKLTYDSFTLYGKLIKLTKSSCSLKHLVNYLNKNNNPNLIVWWASGLLFLLLRPPLSFWFPGIWVGTQITTSITCLCVCARLQWSCLCVVRAWLQWSPVLVRRSVNTSWSITRWWHISPIGVWVLVERVSISWFTMNCIWTIWCPRGRHKSTSRYVLLQKYRKE